MCTTMPGYCHYGALVLEFRDACAESDGVGEPLLEVAAPTFQGVRKE